MARPFSYPEVAALEVGQVCDVLAPVSEVRRKSGLYGRRNNKRFSVVESSEGGCTDAVPSRARVMRLPDPPLTSLMG